MPKSKWVTYTGILHQNMHFCIAQKFVISVESLEKLDSNADFHCNSLKEIVLDLTAFSLMQFELLYTLGISCIYT